MYINTEIDRGMQMYRYADDASTCRYVRHGQWCKYRYRHHSSPQLPLFVDSTPTTNYCTSYSREYCQHLYNIQHQLLQKCETTILENFMIQPQDVNMSKYTYLSNHKQDLMEHQCMCMCKCMCEYICVHIHIHTEPYVTYMARHIHKVYTMTNKNSYRTQIVASAYMYGHTYITHKHIHARIHTHR